jgi:hypothetical protein
MRSVAVITMLAACSFGMKRVDSAWDGTTEPDCTDSVGTVAADAIAGGLALGGASAAFEQDQPQAGVALGVLGLVFAVSAAVGEGQANSCKEAKAQWRIGGAIGRASRANAPQRSMDEIDEAEERHRAEQADAAARKRELDRAFAQRGFFCSSSPTNATAAFCTKDKSACETARAAAVGFVADLGACSLTESAWCTGEHCAPTPEACEARRGQLGSDAPACGEQR